LKAQIDFDIKNDPPACPDTLSATRFVIAEKRLETNGVDLFVREYGQLINVADLDWRRGGAHLVNRRKRVVLNATPQKDFSPGNWRTSLAQLVDILCLLLVIDISEVFHSSALRYR